MSATDPTGTPSAAPGPEATAHPPGYTPAASSRTNAMAILSMISAILGLTLVPFVGSIIGVVTGHIARRQIRESGEQGLGPATAGLAIGYIGVALGVIAVVAIVAFLFVVAPDRAATVGMAA